MTQPQKQNRLDLMFERLRSENAAALVTFVTVGDPWPDSKRTADLIVSLAEAGSDVVELGIPYSDPQADGPSIQAASQRALEGGVNPPFCLDVVRLVRQRSQVPIVLMTYYNPVLRCGLAQFASDSHAAGADGFIITDLPPEEAGPWLSEANREGLATIFLLAPTSTDERIAAVADKMNAGFVYCVSRTGVTGARRDIPEELAALIARIRVATPLPVCVGFGITTSEHVAKISSVADGAVIGSALVDFLNREKDSPSVLSDMGEMIKQWKGATRRS